MRTILGVILAGGLARRMGGGDKGLKTLAGRPILARIVDRLRPQVDGVIINANGDPARFDDFGLPVAGDAVEGFAGPLAGVLAGLAWARENRPDITDIVTVPSDGPFLPRDVVARLVAARDQTGADLACAASGGQPHPVVGLWPLRLYEDLHHAVVGEGIRKVDIWTGRHKLAVAHFPTDPVDPFFNANAPDDLAEAERLLARLGDAA
ncbi:MAG TPA: molybdenum cofactor guanylyltransferase MobA [Ferrovibrio sp.]|jgi:molybdopterin-guanine dinucleotide biosynthesis protein A|uniref:molybdenum cofactor guanylyltransferase MobA n=1 Tax=Ferrovibrio sp. TaxID=1917215 RepID=UPI002B4B3BB6|nr:molybdenum cofactor guanylyltransferase MobA [Ferrovibrio sp.]HLT78629.1 molybdenum cofactor guanylyltransferase MobA [Ferrovibrio sp.]